MNVLSHIYWPIILAEHPGLAYDPGRCDLPSSASPGHVHEYSDFPQGIGLERVVSLRTFFRAADYSLEKCW